MTKIIFHTNPMSRGQIARWALHEAGADYEARIVEYGPEMKSAAYLSINPMGKVPAIEHDGRVVTEAAAICAYLADAYPAAGLAPAADERADYYRWLFFAAGPLEQALTLKSIGVVPTTEQQRSIGCGTAEQVSEVLCAKLARDAYVCGGRFTMADVYVGSHVGWGLAFGTLPKLNPLLSYAERVQQREACRTAKAIDLALIAQRSAREPQ